MERRRMFEELKENMKAQRHTKMRDKQSHLPEKATVTFYSFRPHSSNSMCKQECLHICQGNIFRMIQFQ